MKKLLLLVVILILNGCSTTTPPTSFTQTGKPLGTHYLTWPERQTQLMNVNNWITQGSIAIRTEQKGWNASFSWQQQNQNYNLALFGPLGSNRVQLIGNPGNVIMQTTSQTVRATNPETLIQNQLGWNIPVSNLYYWLRGLPVPHDPRLKRSLDLNNHLVQLNQQGWHIIYLRYVSINGVDLPERMLLTAPPLQVRIVITRWEVNP